MRKIVLLLLLLLPSLIYSQDKKFHNLYEYFSVENNKIVWQKIFESDLSQEEIIESLSKNIIFSPISNSLKGHTNIFKLTKIVNYGIMPGYQLADFQMYVEFEFKENKYRVTVTDIRMNFTSEIYAQPSNSFYPLEGYQIDKDGKFSNKTQAKKGLNCINLTFLDIFEIRKSTIKKEW